MFSAQDMQKLQWLEGSWKGVAGDKPFYEAWRVVNDSVLVNFAITINGKDTLVKESGVLRLRQGHILSGQAPTLWRATRLMPNELVLRNDTLRFSNTIIWLHTKDDHWFTILEHPKSTVYYDMTRDPVLDKKVDAWLLAGRRKD